MNREEKNAKIQELVECFKNNNVFYLANAESISANNTNKFRRDLFNNGISMQVAKNTLIFKAMEQSGKDFGDLKNTLKGNTAILISENAKAPAQAILKFRQKGDKPSLKGAYIDSAVYIGDDQLTALSNLKSREELIGEIIGLLQSPVTNVVSALQSAGGNIAGILKTLSEKSN